MFYQLVPKATKYPMLPQKRTVRKKCMSGHFEATYDNVMNHNMAHMLKN